MSSLHTGLKFRLPFITLKKVNTHLRKEISALGLTDVGIPRVTVVVG